MPDTPPQPAPSGTPGGDGAASPAAFRAVLASLWVGNLFTPFFTSGVNVVLPAMGLELGATALELSLVVVVFSLAQSVFSILGGRLGDVWGRRRLLLTGMGLFVAFTVAVGLAPGMHSLLGFRFLQGMASALVSTCATAIAISMAPLPQRGQVMGVLTTAVYLGLTLGPLAGGGVSELFGWRWLFFGTLLPGLLVLAVMRRFIRTEWRAARGEPMDIPGALLLLAGLALVVLGAGCSGVMPELLWLVLPGVAVLGLFLLRERRAAYPLMDVGMFRQDEGLGAGMLAMFVNYGATMGLVFFFSLYLQLVRGLSPVDTGLVLMLQSVVQVAASPLGGRLADKLGAERVSAAGMLLCGLGILGVSMLGRATPLAWMAVSLVCLGVGIGLFNAPNMVATLSHVPGRHLSVASGLMGSMRQMGGLFSQLLITLVLGHYMGDAPLGPEHVDEFLAAMRASLICFGVLNVCGLFIGIRRLLPVRGR